MSHGSHASYLAARIGVRVRAEDTVGVRVRAGAKELKRGWVVDVVLLPTVTS